MHFSAQNVTKMRNSENLPTKNLNGCKKNDQKMLQLPIVKLSYSRGTTLPSRKLISIVYYDRYDTQKLGNFTLKGGTSIKTSQGLPA